MSTPKILGSVSRALEIVEYLTNVDRNGVSLATIAQALSINKATAYTTLYTLRIHGWVEQVEESSNYRLGRGIPKVSPNPTTNGTVVEMIHPTLVAISQKFNELVHLGRFTGIRVRYLDKVEPDQAIRVVSRIGDVAPAVRTGLGRALLGAQPRREERLEHYFADPIIANQPAGVIEELHVKVQENFELLDHHGWVQEIGENQPGICCVAVPLFYEGKPEYAISITTPYDRMPQPRRPELAEGIINEVTNLPSGSPFTVRPVN